MTITSERLDELLAELSAPGVGLHVMDASISRAIIVELRDRRAADPMTNPETSSDLVKRLKTGKLSYMSDSGPVWEGGGDLHREAATTIERLTAERDEALREARRYQVDAENYKASMFAAESLNARQAEALKEIDRVLVYSFEDAPEDIHVTYDGLTLAVLDLDSEQGSAALRLEQHLSTVRASMASTALRCGH